MDKVTADDQKKVLGLLSLPVEVIVYIVLLLTARDKVTLRHVSRRLQTIMETPSLWHEFVWPLYNAEEEGCVERIVKWCGVYVKRLSFPDDVPKPQLFWRMLHWCSNVVELNLTATDRYQDHLSIAIAHLAQLEKLDIRWNGRFPSLLTFTNNLKELTVRIKHTHEPSVLASVNGWITEGFKVRSLNIVYYRVHVFVKALLEKWTLYNSHVPDGHTGYLRLYSGNKDLSCSLPMFQLQFGKAATLPFLDANKFGLVDLKQEDLMLMTICSHSSTVVHNGIGALEHNNAIQRIGNLKFLTDFSISDKLFNSEQLESLAVLCPNLQRLNLQNSINCLKSLKGLYSVANHCHHLEKLNLLGISAKQVDHVELWKVLSNIKLTHLAIQLCNTAALPNDVQTLAILYNKCSSLEALHLKRSMHSLYQYGCSLCKSYSDDYLLLLSQFPSLTSCLVEKIPPCQNVNAIKNILANCKHLKYFKFTLDSKEAANYCNIQPTLSFPFACSLQQLYIVISTFNIPDVFMNTVSAHGGLVHVILHVSTIRYEGIVTLIENSPELLTLHVHGIIWVTEDLAPDSVDEFKETMRKRFPSRKLFTAAGSIEMHRAGMSFYRSEDLDNRILPFW